VQVEASDLPSVLEVSPNYSHAFVLFRWRGVPVGHTTIPVQDGTIGSDALVNAMLSCAGDRIAEYRVAEFLDGEATSSVGAFGPTRTSCSIAVCTRDRPDDLDRCLTSIAELPDEGQDVLVVDSASSGHATHDVARRYPGVRYYREERPGLSVARNRALREARGDIVAFCDDDAAPDPIWLRALAASFAEPRTLCVTGLTLPLELETPAQEWFELTNSFSRGYRRVVYDGLDCDPLLVARVGAGVNMAFRRTLPGVVGPFDESLGPGTPTQSGDDHDMFTRILAAGYRIVYEPRALSWHRHRREWSELTATGFGYGAGVYAYLTKQLLAGELRAPIVALRWLPHQLRGLVRGLRGRPGGVPRSLALAELRGCLRGSAAYFRSRRKSHA
jgi:GT2 family glycosyltransferase